MEEWKEKQESWTWLCRPLVFSDHLTQVASVIGTTPEALRVILAEQAVQEVLQYHQQLILLRAKGLGAIEATNGVSGPGILSRIVLLPVPELIACYRQARVRLTEFEAQWEHLSRQLDGLEHVFVQHGEEDREGQHPKAASSTTQQAKGPGQRWGDQPASLLRRLLE